MEKLNQSHNVAIQWRSFELRPKGGPPLSPDYLEKVKSNRPRIYAVAKEQYGLEMNPGPFGFDSRPALAGAKYAEAQGVGPAYHAAIMQAYWQEAQAIDDVDVLSNIAGSVGLEKEAFRNALEENLYLDQVVADIEQAHNYGIHGVPGMVFANKYLVSGAQPYDVLVQAVEQIREESA